MDKLPDSTFGERFAFARWWEEGHIRHETDHAFAEAIGWGKGTVSGWRRLESPPPADACTAIAERTGIDVGWLTYGGRTGAIPAEFDEWLRAKRRGEAPIARGKGQPVRAVAERAVEKKTAAKKGGRRRAG